MKAVLIGLAVTVLSAGLIAQPYPNPKFCSFFDSTSTLNGQLVPVGSIIKAYDPQGVLCGIDTFGVNPTAGAGHFGYMPVYGDDATTSGLDEGAVTGETIQFTINGRVATVVSGTPTWTDQAQKHVNLSATSNVVVALVDGPDDTLVTIDRTIRFTVKVRNDGNGLDFFSVSAENSDTSYHTVALDSFVYADSGETVSVTFDVHTPVWADDTTDVITYTVYSQVDTAQKITGTVNLTMSLTDVGDGHHRSLPSGFALFQNYPNPFNPSTVISYSLASRASVRLEIIDLLGRIVDSRELGEQSSGTHEIEFNASALSSGVYFYRVATTLGTQSRKMVLLK